MSAGGNVALYPWFKFFQNLLFWQATWFLFFQSELTAAQAVLMYVVYDIATTLFEVPSGYFSDRIGRRITLVLSSLAGLLGTILLAVSSGFWMFALAQAALGLHMALASGTDSSLLYESLAEDGREDDIEIHEVRAWRFNFVALAISAVLGGLMALWGLRIPFFASVIAIALLVIVVLRFREPEQSRPVIGERARLDALAIAFRKPVLLWIFALAALMYGFSHLPFIFGQPFILSALGDWNLSAEAPVVSGAVTALMMLISVATSWLAPTIRARIGLAGILLLAFAIQIGLVAGLALTGSALAISLLLLRMVPDSFSRPFILARIQKELTDDVRATYISIQNLVARLLFAGSLFLASGTASDVGLMSYEEIRVILTGYAFVGLVAFATLALTARGRGV